MKLLLLSDQSIADGGEEIRMESFRRALKARGHDVRIFSSDVTMHDKACFADYTCKGSSQPRIRPLLSTANPWAYWKLKELLNDFAPDMVHVNSFLMQLSPLILPPLKAYPSVFNVAWHRAVCPTGTKQLPDGSRCANQPGTICLTGGCLGLRDWPFLVGQHYLWKGWRRNFDAIVANSYATKKYLVEAGIENVEVIWNGVPASPERQTRAANPTITFAGRLVAEKGVDVLIESFALVSRQMPNAELLIMGEGSGKHHFLRMIESLHLQDKVQFLGYVTRDEVHKVGSRAWVHVVPSLWDEPFGLSAAEALIRGVPVVASKRGGLQEVVKDGETGFLVTANDSHQLANAILRVISNDETAARLGKSARADAVRRFSEEQIVDQWLALYDRILSVRN